MSPNIREAVGYVRVSTVDQASEGISLDAQRAKLRAWAELNGYDLVAVEQDVLSGKRADNRRGLQSALDQACRQKAALVVYSLTRLARSTRDALDIADRLNRAGADLVSLSERLDTTTAAGRMVFGVLSVLGEFERAQLVERTTAAMGHLRRIGRRISGHIPYGFCCDGGHLVPIDRELRVVDFMRRLRERGFSYPRIAARLFAAGVATKEGRQVWGTKVIRAVLLRAEKLAAA